MLTYITPKLEAVNEHYIYLLNDYSTVGNVYFLVKLEPREIWLGSYRSKHTLQSLSYMSFVNMYVHNLKTIQVGRDLLFLLFSELSLYTSYDNLAG